MSSINIGKKTKIKGNVAIGDNARVYFNENKKSFGGLLSTFVGVIQIILWIYEYPQWLVYSGVFFILLGIIFFFKK